MKFEIAFNLESDDKTLIEIGATLFPYPYKDEEPPFTAYQIEINSFEELRDLLYNVNVAKKEQKDFYSAVISFDPPTIYLDNKV